MAPQSLSENSPVPYEWRRWAAEAWLREANTEDISGPLHEHGFAADCELAAIASHPYVEAGEWIAQRLRKLESLLDVYTQLASLVSDPAAIDRRRDLTREDFLTDYYSRNRPVVIEGLLDQWPALARWTPAYLASVCGDAVVEVMDGRDGESSVAQYRAQHRRTMRFAEYVDLVCASAPTNRFFIVSGNDFLQHPEVDALWADIPHIPAYLDEVKRVAGSSLWFGPAGTVTPLHHDLMNILFTQITGRKEIQLIPSTQTHLVANENGVFSEVDAEQPDLQRFPRFGSTTAVTIVLEPGQTLFIPVGWWHNVRALDVCISVAFTNFLFPNDYEWRHPAIDRSAPPRTTT
jgi:ribosomal protein L16 Arg81 hydroxylase